MRKHSIFDRPFNFMKFRMRIMRFVDVSAGPSGCWIWVGNRQQEKNRRLAHGRVNVHGTKMYAHIVVYELATKKRLSKRRILRHSCDNAKCCNPNHMIPGTQRQNVLDSVRAGRHRSPRVLTPKMTLEKARMIRSLAGQPHTAIATLMGVSRDTVGKILRGKAWKDGQRSSQLREPRTRLAVVHRGASAEFVGWDQSGPCIFEAVQHRHQSKEDLHYRRRRVSPAMEGEGSPESAWRNLRVRDWTIGVQSHVHAEVLQRDWFMRFTTRSRSRAQRDNIVSESVVATAR